MRQSQQDSLLILLGLRTLMNIPNVLNNFDSCDYSNTDKLGNKKFVLAKDLNSVVYIVTIQRGKRKLEIKTMWKTNLSGASC